MPLEMKGLNSEMLQIPLTRQLPAPIYYKFHQNAAIFMNNERLQSSNSKMLQKQLKWRLPSAKCCKQQEEQAEKHIQIKQNNSEILNPFFFLHGAVSLSFASPLYRKPQLSAAVEWYWICPPVEICATQPRT